MLLTDQGLAIHRFEPVLAAALGNGRGEEGANVLVQALARGSARVELCDWLFCLATTPGSLVRKRLVDALGQSADDFVAGLQGGLPSPAAGAPPLKLAADSAAPEVATMLARAEALAAETGRAQVTDAMLSDALLASAPPWLNELLEAWASAPGLAAFRRLLDQQIHAAAAPPSLFDERDRLQRRLFAPSGWRLCRRLAEDAASLHVGRIGTRHLLYTLLGDERGLLVRALTAFGVNVKRDLHAALCREIARPGRLRPEAPELARDTLLDTVVRLFEHAHKLAAERGAEGIAEHDVAIAFASRQAQELERLLAGQRGLTLAALRAHLENTDPLEEDEADDAQSHPMPVEEIAERINRRICGQPHAVAAVVPLLELLHFDYPRDGRPAGVFLFLGPTGTGKTQLAKELARFVFGDEEQMLFLEMGQFKTKESMNMFTGAPPGYVGYGEGKLTNGLRDRPRCVVLFDEIEKADTQVFDALLRFADEGLISDPAGPVRDGRKCIIVMTTNAGQTWLRTHLQSVSSARDEPEALAAQLFAAAMQELLGLGFRPEFLGRVDARITFLPLSLAACRQIVDQVLEREVGKFRALKDVELEVRDDARALLARWALARSLDEGARGVPRAIHDQVVSPAIRLLVQRRSGGVAVAGARLVATALGEDRVVVEVLS